MNPSPSALAGRLAPLAMAAGLASLPGRADTVENDLHVERASWSPEAGLRPTPARTINGGIPGPVLRYREGDTAVIRVHNDLEDQPTLIHWHGLLVPNDQDGVPGTTGPAIPPGASATFRFTLHQSGTYWYHSHVGLQEQEGVFGAIVIEPRAGEPQPAAGEEVLVLSDWTRQRPETVMRALRRGDEWYGIAKGTAPHLLGAFRAGALREFFQRERERMPPMDISDVAYDAFLINGRRELQGRAAPGSTVRLRIVNAASSSYFYLESATGPLTVVAADGPAVEPVELPRLLVGMAETYDVLLRIPDSGRWELRATAQDGSGHASFWLGEGEEVHPAPDIPRPDNYRMEHHLMAAFGDADPAAPRPLSPALRLRAAGVTAFDPDLPRRDLTLRLTGNMERYVWGFDGRTIAEDGVIPVQGGEVLRLTFVNDTMMHHPLHLHGHFFRVLDPENPDAANARAPLKHTLDVPPMATRVVEFAATEPGGDWLFHCHLLYHMHAGMARVVSYQDPAARRPVHLGEHAHDHPFWYLDATLESAMTEGRLWRRTAYDDLVLSWQTGWDEPWEELEADLAWQHSFDSNNASRLGLRREEEEFTAFAGLDHRLPYLLWSQLQLDARGDLRLGLSRSIPLTRRFSAFGEVRHGTSSQWEWSSGLEYRLSQRLLLIGRYHSDFGWSAGLGCRF